MLGARKNTIISLYTVESGVLPVMDLVRKNRENFLIFKLEHENMGKLFRFVYDLCRKENTPRYRLLNSERLQISDNDPLEREITMLKNTPKSAPKIRTYVND